MLIIYLVTLLTLVLYCGYIGDSTTALGMTSDMQGEEPVVIDPSLEVQLVYKGLDSPTSMMFLGPGDILVLEKNTGTVRRIINGNILQEPFLKVDVSAESERGLLGIAISKGENGSESYVFVYYTASEQGGDEAIGNLLYRYDLVNNKLENPKLLLGLPAGPGRQHNGGVLLLGPDDNLYLSIGDVKGPDVQNETIALLDGRSGILRTTKDGLKVGEGILGQKHPLDKYYAYGVRNSFGMDFDPITGKLWDTENGNLHYDEINLVEPGFNSGWPNTQGPASPDFQPDSLMTFDGKANYSDPEFSWRNAIGVTALKFLNSDSLGKRYENDIFVGDINHGNIYHFDLNGNRTGVKFVNERLNDKSADNPIELRNMTFATGFSGNEGYRGFPGVSDIEVGPDGYLYIVSYGQGAIYKIVPRKVSSL
jgi:aldose sugar dehydrogenase